MIQRYAGRNSGFLRVIQKLGRVPSLAESRRDQTCLPDTPYPSIPSSPPSTHTLIPHHRHRIRVSLDVDHMIPGRDPGPWAAQGSAAPAACDPFRTRTETLIYTMGQHRCHEWDAMPLLLCERMGLIQPLANSRLLLLLLLLLQLLLCSH